MSIRSQFAIRLAAPAIVLVLAWGAVAGAVLSGALIKPFRLRFTTPHHRVLVESSVVAGTGIIAIVAVLALSALFARRLSRDVSELAATARRLADGQPTGGSRRVRASAEVATAATALAGMQQAASAAASAERAVRDGLRQILASLGKRNQALLHRQLRIIDTLEEQASGPAALAELFALDHLTTRMRRHAESLTILSGATSTRSWTGPVQVIDVIRAAVAEIEDYKRVVVLTDSPEAVAAAAVTDMIHVLAELIENAALFSPSSTKVEVRAERVANGFAIEVEDRGLGIAHDQLAEINKQLAQPPDYDLADADRLGLFVVGRLAARHDVSVSLCQSAYRGTKAVVILPDSIVTTAVERSATTAGSRARLDLQSAGALTLADTAATSAPASASATQTATQTARPPLPTRTPDQTGPLHPVTDDDDTFHGLPRRTRPAAQAPAAAPAGPAESPAPEHARRLVSSLQSGWQRSRNTDEDEDKARFGVDGPSTPLDGVDGPSTPWPDSKEM